MWFAYSIFGQNVSTEWKAYKTTQAFSNGYTTKKKPTTENFFDFFATEDF